MKIQKILILTTLTFFIFLIMGNVSAISTNTTDTIKKPITTTTSGSSVQVLDPYENPDIDGNIVVYQKTNYLDNPYIPKNSAIYWKNINNNQGGKVSSYFDDYLIQENPTISGTKVVWSDNRIEGFAIYWKDISTGSGGKVSIEGYDQVRPDICGNIVVWEDSREGSYISWTPVIYWKNIVSGDGGRVSTYKGSNLLQLHPAVSGTKVVWQDYRENNNPVIYWKDIYTGAGGRVSSYNGPNLDQEWPAISGTKVVWNDWREGHSVIYWKDISTGTGGRVSSYYGSAQVDPAIFGNKVVCTDYREDNAVIYWKDLSTGNGGRVSTYHGAYLDQKYPAISGNKVVWQDARLGYMSVGSNTIPSWAIYWKDLAGDGGLVAGESGGASIL